MKELNVRFAGEMSGHIFLQMIILDMMMLFMFRLGSLNSYQKQKRNKTMSESIFSSLKGMGKKRQEKLLIAFDGPEQISKMTPEVINTETGIPIKIAKEIIKLAKTI